MSGGSGTKPAAPEGGALSPVEEARELTRMARAWLEWSRDCGTTGAPSGIAPEALLRGLDDGSLGRAAAGRPAPSAPSHARAPAAATAPPTATPPAAREPRPAAPQAAPPPREFRRDEPPARPAAPAAAPELSPEERRAALDALEREVAACTRCPLHEGRIQTVFARGNPDAELVFVGEGPGAREDEQGKPFVGPAGQLLDKMIGAMGFDPGEVYICNIVKCRPPRNRKPTEEEVAACAPFLEQQLSLVRPKAMVALGATGVQGLLGVKIGITRLRGNWKVYRARVPLMPTFHPAYLLRQPEKKREVWEDLKKVMKRLGRSPSRGGGGG